MAAPCPSLVNPEPATDGWYFDFSKSTEEMYGRQVSRWCEDDFAPQHRAQRMALDPNYHWHYSWSRQVFQDQLVTDVLGGKHRHTQNPFPWVVFTAGPMGAGKGYTVRWMEDEGYFPMLQHDFVTVDPDEIRRNLPEWEEYVAQDPSTAGERTHKEACLLCELCTLRALQSRRNIVIDGSLRDAEWHVGYFSRLRKGFPGVRIAILHVTAPVENIKANVHQRFLITGRMVPEERVLESISQVPKSVELLAPLTDFCCRVENKTMSGDPELLREPSSLNPPSDVELDWTYFTSLWCVTTLGGDDQGKLSEEALSKAIRKGVVRKTTVGTMDLHGRKRVSTLELEKAIRLSAIGNLRDTD